MICQLIGLFLYMCYLYRYINTECMRQGAVMSATALELVMENEQVLNPTDVLAKHPYIAEAVENKVSHSSDVVVESIID